jgi:hypothetical protein
VLSWLVLIFLSLARSMPYAWHLEQRSATAMHSHLTWTGSTIATPQGAASNKENAFGFSSGRATSAAPTQRRDEVVVRLG